MPSPAESSRPYWSLATEAELRSLLGDSAEATELIKRIAAGLGPAVSVDWQAIASTRRQIRRTCRHLDVDAALLEPLRPPRVIAYTGHMIGP
jgi:hypothetical protein